MNLREAISSSDTTSRNNSEINSIDEEIHELYIAQESFSEMMLESSEMTRLHEVAVGLEELNQICSFIKNASKTDLALIETSTNIALAGSDISAEEIIPSIESYEGGEVSTEAIGKFAISIWKTILKSQKRYWTTAVRFYNSIFRSVPKLRKSADALKIRADGSKEKSLSATSLKIGSATATLSCDYKGIEDLSELGSSLESYAGFTAVLLNEYTSAAIEHGDVLVKYLSEEIIDDPSAIVELAKKCLLPKNPLKDGIKKSDNMLTSSEMALDDRFNDAKSYMVPSGVRLYQSKIFVTDLATDKDVDGKLKELGYKEAEGDARVSVATDVLDIVTKNKTEIVMAYSKDKKPKLPKKGSAKPIEYHDVETVADSILAICDSIEMNSSSDKVKEIEKVGDKIETVTKKLSSSVDKAEVKSGASATGWRLIAGLNMSWVMGVTKPQSQWINHIFAVSRASIDVCNKSLSLYE